MDLGDRMKLYEGFTNISLMPRLPAIIRIDGKCFHQFVKGLTRPFDVNLSTLMIETTKFLVKEFSPSVGYTQSDEISLMFWQKEIESELPFAGRVQKLASVMAAITSAYFNKNVYRYLPSKVDKIVAFDARAFNVPSQVEAYNYFLWREQDATKNSITMAASMFYSHKELQGKNSSEKQEMLFQAGRNWNDYPNFFKRGTYVNRSNSKVVSYDELPPLAQMEKPLEFLFNVDTTN